MSLAKRLQAKGVGRCTTSWDEDSHRLPPRAAPQSMPTDGPSPDWGFTLLQGPRASVSLKLEVKIYMDAKSGDHIIVESAKVGSARRSGQVVEVVKGSAGEHYRVEWEDGHHDRLLSRPKRHGCSTNLLNAGEREKVAGLVSRGERMMGVHLVGSWCSPLQPIPLHIEQALHSVPS